MVAACTPAFRNRAPGNDNVSQLHEQIKAELYWVVEFLRSTAPRTLLAKETRRPLLVFTDVALEGDDSIATIGGVMLMEPGANIFRLNCPMYSWPGCKPKADMR